MISEIARKLVDVGTDVLVPLRFREGLDEEKFQQLLIVFGEAKEALADADPVFKFLAWTLFETVELFGANICIYGEEQQQRRSYAVEEYFTPEFDSLQAQNHAQLRNSYSD